MQTHISKFLLYIFLVLCISLALMLGSEWSFAHTICVAVVTIMAAFMLLLKNDNPLSVDKTLVGFFVVLLVVMIAQVMPIWPVQWLHPAVQSAYASLGFERDVAAWSIHPRQTLSQLMAYIGYGCIFYLGLTWSSIWRNNQAYLHIFLLLIIIQLSIGVGLYVMDDATLLGGVHKWRYAGIFSGTFASRNVFALYMCFGFVISSILFINNAFLGKSFYLKSVVCAVISLLCIACIVYSRSKVGILLLAVSVPLMAMFFFRQFISKKRSVFIGIAAIVLLVVASLSMPLLSKHVGSVLKSQYERADKNEQLLQAVKERPWLGYGGGTFADAYHLAATKENAHFIYSPKQLEYAYNSYLKLSIEWGVPAVGILLLMLCVVYRPIVIHAWRDHDELSIAVVVIGGACAVSAMFDYALELPAILAPLVCMLAVSYQRARGKV